MCTITAMAIASAGQAVASHIGQVQAATADNENRARLYRHQQGKLYADERKNITEYYLRGIDSERQWAKNAMDYNAFVAQQQTKVNRSIEESLQFQESSFVEFAQLGAKAASRSGATSKRLLASYRSKRGRELAKSKAKIDSVVDDFAQLTNTMWNQKKEADQKALLAIGLKPQRGLEPVKPTWNRGPSLLSLGINVASGFVTGAATGKSLNMNEGFLFDKGSLFEGLIS